MKRLFCLLLVLCLMLTGCGKKTAEVPATEASTSAPATEATEPPITEATEPPTTEVTEPEPTEPPVPVNPLTGEPLDEEYTGRPVAFSLNNHPSCLPQYGLNKLDWMFEVETEGGITRCVGLITTPENAGTLGPVRSCRSYFLNISVSYDAPLFHCGSSYFADANRYSFTDSVSEWDHVNEQVYSNYFFRDEDRYNNQGYAWEHTLFTNGELITEAMEDFGYNNTDGQSFCYGYQFSQDVQLQGQTAETLTIPFMGGKTTTMKYNSDTGLYEAYQYDEDWVDGDTGENADFRNLLIITTDHTIWESGHSFYDLDGTGDGYFACGGKMIPVKWHHEDAKGPFHFTLEDGTPITLGVGKTYCAIIDASGSVTAE